jgi:hypothetical protein
MFWHSMGTHGLPKRVGGDFMHPLCIYSRGFNVLVACKARTVWPDDV